MGVSLGNAFGKITIDASGARSGAKEAEGALTGFRNAAVGVGGVIQGILGAQIIQKVTGAMMEFGKSIVSEAVEAQNVQAQLAAVLESTGQAAGVSAGMANALADAFSKSTRFSDEAILSGENILLTFTKIGSNVFPATTKTMLNMSQALGQDLKGSAIQLGKALNDPVQGITALRRVGVNFSDAQERVIKQLVATGKLEEAQKLILAELETEFGGSAEAAGKTFAGQLDILKNRLSNVKEALGGLALEKLSGLMDRAAKPVGFLTDGLQALASGDKVGAFTSFRAAIYAFTSAVGMGDQAAGVFRGTMTGLVQDVLVRGLSPITAVKNAFLNILPPGAKSLFGGLIGSVGGLGKAFQDSLPMIQSFGRDMWGFLVQTVGTVGPLLVQGVTNVVRTITQIWQQHGSEIMAVLNFVWRTIVTVISVALTLAMAVIQAGMQLIQGIINTVSLAIKGDWNGAWEAIKSAVLGALETIWQGIVNAFGQILTAAGSSLEQFNLAFQTGLATVKLTVTTALNNVLQTIQAKVSEFVRVGSAIIAALVGAITNGMSGVVKAITGLVQSAINTAMEILGINSPSRVFMGIGSGVTEGMVKGVTRGIPSVLSVVRRMGEQMTALPLPTLNATLVPASTALTANASLAQPGHRVEVNNYAPQYHSYKGIDAADYRANYSGVR